MELKGGGTENHWLYLEEGMPTAPFQEGAIVESAVLPTLDISENPIIELVTKDRSGGYGKWMNFISGGDYEFAKKIFVSTSLILRAMGWQGSGKMSTGIDEYKRHVMLFYAVHGKEQHRLITLLKQAYNHLDAELLTEINTSKPRRTTWNFAWKSDHQTRLGIYGQGNLKDKDYLQSIQRLMREHLRHTSG